MGQEKENEVLIEVTLDEAATEKRVIGLREKLEELRATRTKLNKEFKEGAITGQEYAAAITKVERETKAVTKEIGQNQKALDLNEKVTKSATGSLNQMRAALIQAKERIGDLSAEERASAAGRKLIRDTDELNTTVLEIEKSYGVFGRQVANYELIAQKTIETQAPIIGQLTSIHSTLQDGIGYLKQNKDRWIESGKAAKESLVSTAKLIVGAKQSQEDQDKAIKLSSISITSFGKAAKAALAATGIGLLVLAFGALIGFLTRTQSGIDLIERKTKGFTAIISFLSQKVYEIGEQLVNVWKNPGEAVKKFGDFIQENLINRVKGFGVILKAIGDGNFSGVVDGVIQVGLGITDASKKASGLAGELSKVAKQGEAIATESQRIRDAELKLNVERKNSRAIIERLKMIADDTTKSTKERISAAQKAGKMETDLLAKQEVLQKNKIANIKAENKLNGNLVADQQKLAEAEAELADIREDSFGKQTEVQNTLNGLVQEGKEKAIEAQKEILTAQISNGELLLRAAQNAGKETLALEEGLVLKRAELEKKDVKNKAVRQAIDMKAEADILDLRVANAMTEQERFFKIQQAGVSAKLALVKKGTVEEANLVKEQITNQAQQDRISTINSIKNAEEQKAKLAEIDASEKAQKLAVDASLKAQLAQNDATAIQARLNAVREGSDEEFQLRKELLDAQLKAELENVTLTEEQKKEIKSRYAKEQAAVDQQKLAKEKNDAITSTQTRLNATRAGSQAEYRERKDLLAKQEALEIQQAGKNALAIQEIRSRYARAQLDLEKQHFDEIVDYASSVASQGAATLSAIFEAQDATAQASLDKREKASLKSAGTNAELRAKVEEQNQKKREALEQKANRKKKGIAKAEAGINTAVAATKALTAGPIVGPIMAALITLQGLAQIATIDAKDLAYGGVAFFESDRRGNVVRGPGTSKSDSIPANLSNGESVNNANSTAMFYDEYSAMNVAGGGRAFPGAKPVQLAYGGVATNYSPPRINYASVVLQNDVAAMEGAFVRAVSKLPAPVLTVEAYENKSKEVKQTIVRSKL